MQHSRVFRGSRLTHRLVKRVEIRLKLLRLQTGHRRLIAIRKGIAAEMQGVRLHDLGPNGNLYAGESIHRDQAEPPVE